MSDNVEPEEVEKLLLECQLQECLIPGLPDDLALLCLVRVPSFYHAALRSVCKGWKATVEKEEFLEARFQADFVEPWIFAMVSESRQRAYDSAFVCWRAFNVNTRTWISVPNMPMPFCQASGMQAVAVKGKLVVCGGLFQGACLNGGVVYDPMLNKWTRSRSMQDARTGFAVGVLRDKVYVVGGEDDEEKQLSMECYDVVEDTWTCAPRMDQGGDWGGRPYWWSIKPWPLVVVNDKLYMCTRKNDQVAESYAFCPDLGAWKTEFSDIFAIWQYFDPFSVTNGRLFWPLLQGETREFAQIALYDQVLSVQEYLEDVGHTRDVQCLVDLKGTLGIVMTDFAVASGKVDFRQMRVDLEWLSLYGCPELSSASDFIFSCHVLYF